MDELDRGAAIVERVHARAALAGNPSDGYGGAVFGVPVPAFTTTANLVGIESGYEFVDAHSGTDRFGHWSDVERAVATLRADTPHCLVLGAVATVAAGGGTLRPFRLRIDTTIPMSVGLAGSSAIVIAALRALLRWDHDVMSPNGLALAALEVETEHLGIAAGLQDRVVQVHGQPMLMRFDREATRSGPGTFTPVVQRERLRLLVALRPGSAEPSQVVHGDLRARFEADTGDITAAMSALAGHAIDAAAAFASGDVERLGAAMDSTFDIRTSLLDLSASHVEMIEAARSRGAHANYTGSGGAIVALCPSAGAESATRQSLKSLGCTVVPVVPADPTTEDDDETSD